MSNNELDDEFLSFKFNENLKKIIVQNNKLTQKSKQKTKLYECNGV